MTRRPDPNLLRELKEHGAVGVEKCINCCNCTAICSLTKENDRFPRHMVRLVQLGMKEELLGRKELWLCYNCGDCSETCPQQAEPANLMGAARCYAVTHYAPLKIGALFCAKPLIGAVIATLMTLFFSLFTYSEREHMSDQALELFGFIPYKFIHNFGLTVMVIIGLLSVATVFTMVRRIAGYSGLTLESLRTGPRLNWWQAFWNGVIVQSLGQQRYRTDCEGQENIGVRWYFRKWFVHAATMWGFLGLLFATSLNYFLDIIGVKPTGTFVPLWYPTRLIGTLSGLLFMYGVTILMYKRWRRVDKAHSFSRPSDWTFLALLWLSGITGFIIEFALYLPGAPRWGYWMFIFHVAVSITLLLLLPFTKFAHAIYRTVALFVHELKPVPAADASPEPGN